VLARRLLKPPFMTATMEENPGRDLRPVLEPLAVLPVQMASIRPATASQRLMLAVLREALDDYRRALTSVGRSVARERLAMESWFWSTDLKWPYSFINICQALNLDVDALRSELRRWRLMGFDTNGTARANLRIRLPHRPQRGSRTRTTSSARGRSMRRVARG